MNHKMNRFHPTKLEQTLRNLPSLPSAVVKVQQLTQCNEVDFRLVARTVSEDPALTARLLRLANSPFFGLSGQIGSVRQACIVLGTSGVRNLALAASVSGCLQPLGEGGVNRSAFWLHAAKTASAAKALAKYCDADADLAFIAGLLHDLGILVFDACLEGDVAKQWLSSDAPRRDSIVSEQQALGVDHCTVGECAAQYWRFPEAVCLAIAGHHGSAPAKDSLYARMVRIADFVCSQDANCTTDFLPELHELAQPLKLHEDALGQWCDSIAAMQEAGALPMD